MISKIIVLLIIGWQQNLVHADEVNVGLEDEFVRVFGNNSPLDWVAAEYMDEYELVDLCENARIQAGIGSLDVGRVQLEYGVLKLSDTTKYRNMRVSVLKCVGLPFYNPRSRRRPHFVSPKGELIESECEIFYLTQGTRPDTVIYLNQMEKERGVQGEKVFIIWKLVGGLLITPKPTKVVPEKSSQTINNDALIGKDVGFLLDVNKKPPPKIRGSVSADKILLRKQRDISLEKTSRKMKPVADKANNKKNVEIDNARPEKSLSVGRNRQKKATQDVCCPASMFMYQIPYEIMYP